MIKTEFIKDVKQMTPEWFTRVLRNQRYLKNGKVTEVIVKKTQETVESNVSFLELVFSNDIDLEGLSSEVVVKMSKSDPFITYLGKHEAKFYSIVAESAEGLPILDSFETEFSEETDHPFIILENVHQTHMEIGHFHV